MHESDIIPFKTSPLPESPWLIFSPHADDETFGIDIAAVIDKKRELMLLYHSQLEQNNYNRDYYQPQ